MNVNFILRSYLFLFSFSYHYVLMAWMLILISHTLTSHFQNQTISLLSRRGYPMTSLILRSFHTFSFNLVGGTLWILFNSIQFFLWIIQLLISNSAITHFQNPQSTNLTIFSNRQKRVKGVKSCPCFSKVFLQPLTMDTFHFGGQDLTLLTLFWSFHFSTFFLLPYSFSSYTILVYTPLHLTKK